MSTETIDPTLIDFDIDVAGLDTTRPILGKGEYPLVVSEIEFLPNSAQTGVNMKATFETIDQTRSNTGDVLGSGFKLFKYFPMQPNPEKAGNPDYDADGFKKALTRFMDACNNVKDVSQRARLNTTNLLACKGKKLTAKVAVENNDQFGLSNSVSDASFKPYTVAV